MNRKRKLIINVLENLHPLETGFVGPVVVEDIVDDVRFGRSEAASNLDLATAMTIIASSVVIIKGSIEIFFMLKDKLKRKPTRAEVVSAAKEAKLIQNKDAEVDWNAIVDTVLELTAGI